MSGVKNQEFHKLKPNQSPWNITVPLVITLYTLRVAIARSLSYAAMRVNYIRPMYTRRARASSLNRVAASGKFHLVRSKRRKEEERRNAEHTSSSLRESEVSLIEDRLQALMLSCQ